MINWILIVLVLVLAFVLFATKEMKHRVFTIVVILFLIFLLLTLSPILANSDLTSFEGVLIAGKTYFSWLIHVFGSVAKFTGNVFKLDWGTNLTG